jgi:DNA-binding PadR family transcriptional regulator
VVEDSPIRSGDLLHRQHALLLQQVAISPNETVTQSTANKGIPKQIQLELSLSARAANGLRNEMVATGWLAEETVKRVVTYSITELGKKQLIDLDRYLPLLPAGGKLNLPENTDASVAREVYLLDALARAPKRTISKNDLDVGFGGKGKLKAKELSATLPHLAMFRDQSCLGLNPATTRAILTELAFRGDIQVLRTEGTESYSLTAGGIASLARLRSQCPVLPPTGKPSSAPNEAVRRGREAFLLLKLLQSARYALWESDSAIGSYPKPLKLNSATAWKVRRELVREGYIELNWDGNEGCYTLTPTGKRHLATLPFDALGEVKVKGSALTELLSAAREGAKPEAGATPTRAESQSTEPALTGTQLEAEIMDIFHELLRERFANLDMVPIHEIRREVAERHGAYTASHAVFDDLFLGLRREKKLRLISISDRSRATFEQLRDSIVGVGETFFYAERTHAPAHGG